MAVSYMDRRRSTADRRSAQRVPLVAAARVESGAGRELGQARDVGRSGMSLVRAGVAHRPSTALRVAFALPDGELVELDTEVVFDRDHGQLRQTGLRFAALSDGMRARIERFVDGAG